MTWVWVFVGIAVVGLIVIVSYVIWLAHKAADVIGELTVLGDRAAQLAELLGQIELPDQAHAEPHFDGRPTVGAEVSESVAT